MASIKEDCILEVRIMSRKIVIHHQLLPRKKFQWLTQFQVASNCNIPSLAYLLLNSRKDHSSVYFSVTISLLCYLIIGSFALVLKCHKKSCLCIFAKTYKYNYAARKNNPNVLNKFNLCFNVLLVVFETAAYYFCSLVLVYTWLWHAMTLF